MLPKQYGSSTAALTQTERHAYVCLTLQPRTSRVSASQQPRKQEHLTKHVGACPKARVFVTGNGRPAPQHKRCRRHSWSHKGTEPLTNRTPPASSCKW